MSIESVLLIGDDVANTERTVDFMVEFVNQARESLRIAIYDFRLNQPETLRFVDALEKKARAGVEVMIAYDHRTPPSITPGSKPFSVGDDPAPTGTHAFLTSGFGGRYPQTKVKVAPIQEEAIGGSKLMHEKVIIADDKAVLMGSANFTDDAWAHQDNNILTIASSELATYYTKDFDELWSRGTLVGTGEHYGTVTSSEIDADVRFSPGQGGRIDVDLARTIDEVPPNQRLHIASMVITSNAVLAALVAALDRGVIMTGIYDGPQMSSALRQMTDPARVALMKNVMGNLVAKHSAPYDPKNPNGLHNFMHDKVMVAGSMVVTGSSNFSESAKQNAEDILFIRDPALADLYATYVEALVAKWRIPT